MSGIVQYVIVRGDLIKTMQWPVGAVIAQACHACTAVIHLFYNDEHTQAYLADLENMHKVVLENTSKSEGDGEIFIDTLFVEKNGGYNKDSYENFPISLRFAPDDKSLMDLHLKLEESKVDHKLWIEQPENIPTCLVIKPYPKEVIQKYCKKFKLLKN